MIFTRRHILAGAAASAFVPAPSFALNPRELSWDDLIPPGVPYGEIIGEGELDEVNDTWRPIYDANASKLNAELARARRSKLSIPEPPTTSTP